MLCNGYGWKWISEHYPSYANAVWRISFIVLPNVDESISNSEKFCILTFLTYAIQPRPALEVDRISVWNVSCMLTAIGNMWPQWQMITIKSVSNSINICIRAFIPSSNYVILVVCGSARLLRVFASHNMFLIPGNHTLFCIFWLKAHYRTHTHTHIKLWIYNLHVPTSSGVCVWESKWKVVTSLRRNSWNILIWRWHELISISRLNLLSDNLLSLQSLFETPE